MNEEERAFAEAGREVRTIAVEQADDGKIYFFEDDPAAAHDDDGTVVGLYTEEAEIYIWDFEDGHLSVNISAFCTVEQLADLQRLLHHVVEQHK